MSTTVTISVRSLVVTAATALAVLAAYVIGSAQAGTSTALAAQGSTSGDGPSIVMTGTGDATGVPDQLRFSLSVHANASDVSTALHSASKTTRQVITAVRAQHVAPKDVKTTGLSINAVYHYSDTSPPVITGYAVTQSMSVLVRTLPDAGATITAAVDAGGNAVRLHDVRLQIGDEDALLRQARADAMKQAHAKAAQYAEAAGRELGEVTSVREVQASPSYLPVYRASALDASVPSVPIRAGTAELHVTVSVVWSFA
jgi:uncharacterized protein YggE